MNQVFSFMAIVSSLQIFNHDQIMTRWNAVTAALQVMGDAIIYC